MHILIFLLINRLMNVINTAAFGYASSTAIINTLIEEDNWCDCVIFKIIASDIMQNSHLAKNKNNLNDIYFQHKLFVNTLK